MAVQGQPMDLAQHNPFTVLHIRLSQTRETDGTTTYPTPLVHHPGPQHQSDANG